MQCRAPWRLDSNSAEPRIFRAETGIGYSAGKSSRIVFRFTKVDMSKWYGSGIMHQKIWIFDSIHLYLGSANMDWKSLTQVKEMGVAVEDCPQLAADASKYFESWWTFSALNPTNQEVFDPAVRIDRRVPSWSTV